MSRKAGAIHLTMEAYRADDSVEEDAINAAHGMLSGILGGERQETREATLRALATLLANALQADHSPTDHAQIKASGEVLRRVLLAKLRERKDARHAA